MTVAELRAKRPEVLDELLALHGREIQAVAFLILRDRAEAEDVLIETLLTAFERGRDLRDEGSLRAWLLRIATNKALTVRRRAARVVRLERVPELRPSPGVASASDSRVALLAGVAALPPRMRAAVVLRYYADLSVEDVAAALGRSPNTVKAQLQAALDRLRISVAETAGDRPVERDYA